MEVQLTDFRPALFNRMIAEDKAFDYYGMERAGHFAVLHWLHAQLGGSTVHALKPLNHPGHRMRWFGEPNQNPDYMSISYGRDVKLSERPNTPLPCIIQIRDIRNMWASRLKRVGPNHPITQPERLNTWREYAKQALGDVDYCNGNALIISYDQWFQSKTYRQQIITDLNTKIGWEITFKDIGMDAVSPIGGGSSFDRMAMDGHAGDMLVLDRWKEFTGLDLPEDLLDLNTRLVGE